MTASTTRTRCQSTGPHGTYWAYAKGCRCLAAVLDDSNYRRRRRSGNPLELVRDATGACRTAQGLAALGFTAAQIATEAGISERLVSQLHAGKDTIRTVKDKALRAAAGRLLAGPLPSGWSANFVRSAARRNGWVSLLAWDDDTIDDPNAQPNLGDAGDDLVDEVAVRRALTGERIRLTPAEREHAFRIGLRMGMTANSIGLRLGMNGGYVKQIARRVLAEQAA